MKKQIVLGALIIIVVATFLVKGSVLQDKSTKKAPEINTKQEEDQLKIISTNPNPLDEAVILPTQSIEFKFNKSISVSEFKHRLDPEVGHKIEAEENSTGTTIRITFDKPLELGNGYTLFVLSNTNSKDKSSLGQEFQYHFSTIKYKGV